jgi:hypothetical protein
MPVAIVRFVNVSASVTAYNNIKNVLRFLSVKGIDPSKFKTLPYEITHKMK